MTPDTPTAPCLRCGAPVSLSEADPEAPTFGVLCAPCTQTVLDHLMNEENAHYDF